MFAAKRSELLLTQIAKRTNRYVSKQNSPYFHGLSAVCVRFKSNGTALQGTIPIMGKGVQVGQHAEVCLISFLNFFLLSFLSASYLIYNLKKSCNESSPLMRSINLEV